MLTRDDEKGGKYFGDFAHPNGDPVVGSEEVKIIKNKLKKTS